MRYNWDVEIPGEERKTIIVRNTNLVWCLLDYFTGILRNCSRKKNYFDATRAARSSSVNPPSLPSHFRRPLFNAGSTPKIHRAELYALLYER